MTIVRDEASADELELATDDEQIALDDEPESSTASASRSWARVVAIAVLGALGALVVLGLFAGPVERVWYRNRQSQLASDMSAPHPRVLHGQAVAVVQVPRLGVNVVVAQGDDPEQLRGGPGHRIGTAMPGRRGNSLVMGHRSAWGSPFGALSKVRRGDLVAVQTRDKKTIAYTVRSVARVGPTETRLLRQSKDHRLTLITGRGGRLSDDRLVVTAISGDRVAGSVGTTVRAETPSRTGILNATLLVAFLAFALAGGAALYLRGRSGTVARIVVVLPLAAVGTLCLLLEIDLFLPPLH